MTQSIDTYEEFVNRILNDQQFRQALEKDPAAVLEKAGVTTNMSDDKKKALVEALSKFNWDNARIVAGSFGGRFDT